MTFATVDVGTGVGGTGAALAAGGATDAAAAGSAAEGADGGEGARAPEAVGAGGDGAAGGVPFPQAKNIDTAHGAHSSRVAMDLPISLSLRRHRGGMASAKSAR